MYSLEFRKSIEKKLKKIAKRNQKQIEIIHKKIEEIRLNPHSFKNLKAPLQHLKRVHIDKSFVLVFSVNENSKTIIIEDFDHHDKIYL